MYLAIGRRQKSRHRGKRHKAKLKAKNRRRRQSIKA